MNGDRRLPPLTRVRKVRHRRGLQHVVEGDPKIVSLVRRRRSQTWRSIRRRDQQDVLLRKHDVGRTKGRGRTRRANYGQQVAFLREPCGARPPTHRRAAFIFVQDGDVMAQQLPGNPVERTVEVVDGDPHALGNVVTDGVFYIQQSAKVDRATQPNGDTRLATRCAGRRGWRCLRLRPATTGHNETKQRNKQPNPQSIPRCHRALTHGRNCPACSSATN